MAVAITQTANPNGAGSGTTITYSGVSIGTAAHDRVVVVCVGTELTSGTPSSATINSGGGAVSMNASTLGSIGAIGARVFWLHVPTGATADIAITFGASQGSTTQHITVYSVTGAQGTAASQNGIGDTDADPISSGAITIPSNGGCVAIAAFADDTTARTWTGITEDPTVDLDAGTFRFTTGTSTTAGSPTITVSGGNNEDGALAWVIFNPNASIERLPAGANLALSTAAPSLAITTNIEVIPAAGNLALSGTAPTLAVSNNRDLSPAAANLALSTVAPSRVTDERRDPASAQLALSTVAPNLALTDFIELIPPRADLALSTTAPTLAVTDHRDLSPARADLILSGTAPTLAVSDNRDLVPATAQLTLSTEAPTLGAGENRNLSPATAQLALSTIAPIVIHTDHRDLSPAGANLILATVAPTIALTANINLSPAAAALLLSTAAPAMESGNQPIVDIAIAFAEYRGTIARAAYSGAIAAEVDAVELALDAID